MGMLDRKFDPRRIPLVSVELNYDHPLARALCVGWFNGRDWIGNKTYTVGSTGNATQFVAGPNGPTALFQSSSANVNWASYNPITTSTGIGTGDLTVAGAAYFATSQVFGTWLSQRITNNQMNCFVGRNHLNSGVNGVIGFQLYSGAFTGATSGAIADGKYHVWAGRRSGTTCNVYQDGADVTSSSTASSSTVWAATQDLTVGDMAQNLSISGIGGHGNPASLLDFAFAWNRALSLDELAWQAREPFAMWRPSGRKKKFMFLAPGIVSVRQPQIFVIT